MPIRAGVGSWVTSRGDGSFLADPCGVGPPRVETAELADPRGVGPTTNRWLASCDLGLSRVTPCSDCRVALEGAACAPEAGRGGGRRDETAVGYTLRFRAWPRAV